MKVPEEFLGKLVAVQLARPVYIFDYGAHVTLVNATGHDEEMLMPKHMMVPTVSAEGLTDAQRQGAAPVPMREAQRDCLQAVQVKKIDDDSIVVDMMVPTASGAVRIVRKLIPNVLILGIDQVVVFEQEAPVVTQQVRVEQPSKPLVQLR